MKALINLKSCHSLTSETDMWSRKIPPYAQSKPGTMLEVVVQYPNDPYWKYNEFFDGKGELSGEIAFRKNQIVCFRPAVVSDQDYSYATGGMEIVGLDELMLSDKGGPFAANSFLYGSNSLISLTRYLMGNGLQRYGVDIEKADHRYLGPVFVVRQFDKPQPSADGVARVLAVGQP